MNAAGKSRLILMHGVLTEAKSRESPKGAYGFFVKKVTIKMIKSLLDNMQEAEDCAKANKDIVWTTVLPVGLKNGSMSDKKIVAVEGSYKIPTKTKMMIRRADVARYILKVAENDLHKCNCVAIGIKK